MGIEALASLAIASALAYLIAEVQKMQENISKLLVRVAVCESLLKSRRSSDVPPT